MTDQTPSAPQYFVVSPFKTGTTSVEAALTELGAGKRPMPYRQKLLRDHRAKLFEHRVQAKHSEAFASYRSEREDRVREDLAPLVKAAARYDIFADAPLGHGHVHPFTLKLLFPDARFIWVERRFKDWIASVQAWEVARPELYPKAHLWQTDPESRAEALRRMRQRRFRGFKAAERDFPDSCLRLDLSDADAMSRLAGFCGCPDPGTPFPHRNASG